jgi:tetratricopeptide (TPR) repeat protein
MSVAKLFAQEWAGSESETRRRQGLRRNRDSDRPERRSTPAPRVTLLSEMAELAFEPVLPGDSALPPLSGNVVLLHAEGPMVSAVLAEAQALCDAGRHEEADAALKGVEPLPPGRPDLALRAMHVRSWMALADGRLDEALEGLQLARGLAEGDAFTDADRGEALFRLGACQYKRNANGAAVSLLTLALELFDRSGEPCDRLRAHTMVWRARCYQRQRDWESARTDVEHALVLADSLGDDQVSAHALFQASLVAERESQWLLARYYASEARQRYENLDDDLNVARLTNNLGGLSFLLGEPEEAALQLADSYRLATELGNEGEAARALSSLAQVHLRTGDYDAAELHALKAIELLDGRADFCDELGNVELVLGRTLLELARFDEADIWFRAAESSFAELGSASHIAAAWVAQGDLAGRRGDSPLAATLYRQAAESLQDFHF